jgi:hypothetical protein
VIHAHTRVRLARKARLRRDPHSGKTMLLYPERGLELSPTAAEIAALCARGGTVATMLDELCARFEGDAVERRERIEAELMAFLRALEDRGLLILEDEP